MKHLAATLGYLSMLIALVIYLAGGSDAAHDVAMLAACLFFIAATLAYEIGDK